MTDVVNAAAGIKISAGMVALAAADVAAQAAVQSVELPLPYIGIPASWLFAALVGALIGVMLLPDQDAARLVPQDSGGRWWRIGKGLLRTGMLGATVAGHAIVGCWLLMIGGLFFPILVGTAVLPFAGIMGFTLRPMLPFYLKIMERFTSKWGGP